MKILLIIVLFWLFNQIRKFISDIQVSNNMKSKRDFRGRKERMDIQDADYEDI